ncbi:mitochondrial import inner membrane translocase subunit TIM17 [Blastocystis sp. subtype 4]|uniref:mitochondrial import inner membrane translocase subunit TIM17 n=1 Tax=Blastocystis sp. subtype 4 TaxID=944170 RepID=UPI000711CD34|nr:mitochondrial import inner membrane translocase subunit TIM17 [Blastocystis sp. subtype 4]KNB46052.1 mitochondrial import inner membrane translocase subunit TIM17 [Blastocystis sp. subtype 4]|eukprot:XP_014529529.1 mitochondrial import inner membrane translocase subunit TIM17 [Blastocystis sp. subtype 4]
MDPGRSPCPYRLVDDTGGAFMIGAIGGAIWHMFRGFRNSPKGSHIQGMVYAVKTRAPVLGGNFAIWGLLYSACDCTFSAIRRKEDVWNSIIAGGLSAGILAMRGGVKVFARNFAQGAVLLGLIEGFNIMLSSYTTKKYNEQMMELYGFDAATSLAAPRTNIVKSDGVFEQDAGKPRM